MGALTGAVHWWEESQLRVLVLTSLIIQFFFLFFPLLRRKAIPGWFRFIMWLAYHGGDAVAIYGLATLFNRHKDQGDGGVGSGRISSSNKLLEVVWAPVLLIHLGRQDGITAYNIEDNELWTRHLLTAVSQVTVAVYVFCKSWSPGADDKKLLAVAILLFIVGVVKCFMKAWAFKRASIYSLVSSAAAIEQMNDMRCNKLEDYVKLAKDVIDKQQLEDHYQVMVMDRLFKVEERGEVSKLFVDLSSPYTRRISIFEKFWWFSEERAYFPVYDSVQKGLATAFFLLYTKLISSLRDDEVYPYTRDESGSWDEKCRFWILVLRMGLPWVSIPLFHQSHREAYSGIDVRITYAILCGTAVLENFSAPSVTNEMEEADYGKSKDGPWPQTVAQYSLAGYYVRNKKHSVQMKIASLVGCKDFVDQHWCMEPCFSSARITRLVLAYLKDGWKQKIQDAATYRSFNNHSSHWGLNMNRPFDECVLIWHLATDFCFFSTSFPDHRCAIIEEPEPGAEKCYQQCSQEFADCKAVQCRQMSNYMVYLLFVNPEMLLPGSRRNLFKTAYDELKVFLMYRNWNHPVSWSRCTPCGDKLEEEAIVMGGFMKYKTGKRASQEESSNEAIVRDTVITVTLENSERSSQEESKMEGSSRDDSLEESSMEGSKCFIHQAHYLAQRLFEMDEVKRWEEIQDAWVQMLCFSASRCRGYLHAKALGKGGEFLSYVWLLLFYMGMETFSERLQRELLPS